MRERDSITDKDDDDYDPEEQYDEVMSEMRGDSHYKKAGQVCMKYVYV
jgi:hypothetical protein